MRILFYIGFVFLSACGPQPNNESQKVEYKISPQNTGFLVEINYNIAGKVTRIDPDSKAYRHFQQLGGTKEYPVRYFIIPTSSEPIIKDTVIDLEAGFFQTVGYGLMTCIGNNIDLKQSIQIIWNAPSNWKFANSFSADQNKQNFEATCSDLRKGLYVGGYDLRVQKTWFGAMTLRGSFDQLTITDIEDALTRNMWRVLKFWEAAPDPYYFVSIRGTNSQQHSGTAQFQSFQLDLAHDHLNSQELDHLISHEYFHNWNGLKINLEPNSDLEHLDIWWFVEGFTDYYAFQLSGLPDTASFSNVSLTELKRNYHTNDKYPSIPYVQGRRIAKKFESQILSYTGGKKKLQHVMHEIIRRSQENPSFYLTRENILKVICDGKYMSCIEAQAILRNHVDLGVSF